MEFSASPGLNIALLNILRSLAADCDNESIVVSDRVRKSFFNYIDTLAPIIFDQVFNLWAQKLNDYQLYDSTDHLQLKLKSKLIDCFDNWLKLKLPDEVFVNLTDNYPDILKLVFTELETSEDDDTLE